MTALEHRIPPPVVVLILGVVMWLIAHYTAHRSEPDGLRLTLTAAAFAVGLVFGGSGVIAFRHAKTTVDPIHLEGASVLVTTGIFRISRNPMYVGFTLMLIAWAVYLSEPWALLGAVAFVLFTWRFQIVPEERFMRTKFGTAYTDYQHETRRWL